MQFLNVMILLTLAKPSISLYFDSDSNVIKLTTDNYSQIYESKKIWIINYYSPTSQQSKDIIPHYTHLSKMFNGLINVAALNCDIKHYFCKQYGVNSLPMIKYYGIGNNYSTYHGKHLLGDLVQASTFAIDRKFQFQLGEKVKKFKQILIQLTDSTFDDLVLHSDNIWIVEFFSSNSGPLKNFFPIYERISRQIRKEGILCGMIDVISHQVKAKEYNVWSTPVFKFFPVGLKSRHSVSTYTGPLERLDLLEWILQLHNQTIPIPTIHQMIDEKAARSACVGKSLCVVTILPTFKNCNANCRHAYLDILHNVANILKRNYWGWLWIVSSTQIEIEKILHVESNIIIPRIMLVDINDKLYWTEKLEPFNVDTVLEFLQNYDMDHSNEFDIVATALPKILKYEIWDGENPDVLIDFHVKSEL